MLLDCYCITFIAPLWDEQMCHLGFSLGEVGNKRLITHWRMTTNGRVLLICWEVNVCSTQTGASLKTMCNESHLDRLIFHWREQWISGWIHWLVWSINLSAVTNKCKKTKGSIGEDLLRHEGWHVGLQSASKNNSYSTKPDVWMNCWELSERSTHSVQCRHMEAYVLCLRLRRVRTGFYSLTCSSVYSRTNTI